MSRILFFDEFGVKFYGKVNRQDWSNIQGILPGNFRFPVLCIVDVDNVVDKTINKFLFQHEFEKALCVVNFLLNKGGVFANEHMLDNWEILRETIKVKEEINGT